MLLSTICANNIMEPQPDFKELLALFNAHQVEYLVVGGYAVAFHGAPRFTGDLDLLVKPNTANAQRILAALAVFGFASAGFTSDDFVHAERVVQLGVPPVRVDLITSLTGISWDEAFSGRKAGLYGDVPVDYIGRAQLVANKRATSRPQAGRGMLPTSKRSGKTENTFHVGARDPNEVLRGTLKQVRLAKVLRRGHPVRCGAGLGV